MAAIPLAIVALSGAFVSSCEDQDARLAGAGSEGRRRSNEAAVESALHRAHKESDPTIACQACHELLAGEYLPAKSWRCTECHEDTALALHKAAEAPQAHECWSCHDFTSADLAPTPCLACHDKPLGTLSAIAPHDPAEPEEDCGRCHRAHQEPSLVNAPCEGCHENEEVSGHDKPGIQIEGCASCHGYHEAAKVAADRCSGCHRQSRADVPDTATFKGHDLCVTCHRPHRFFKAEVIGCNDECHRGVEVLSQGKVPKHRSCINCHDNHDVRGPTSQACEGCHRGKIALEHPGDRQSGTRCVGCHRPHDGPAAPLARPCTTCHAQATSDAGLHQGRQHKGPACVDCHRPHAFQMQEPTAAFCLGCHGSKPFARAKTVRPHEQHRDCFRCHGASVAHQPAGERVACASCHEDKGAAVHEGHARCTGCHDAHSTTLKVQCGGCHREQSGTAPQGHKPCLKCHEPHSTRVDKTCEACHEDRASGIHAHVEGGCRSCHRPHGPEGPSTPPACVSCHDADRLPAAHQVPEHQQCTNCHVSHGEQPYRRPAACLACHTAQRNHQPAAKMCTGCHIFQGPGGAT